VYTFAFETFAMNAICEQSELLSIGSDLLLFLPGFSISFHCFTLQERQVMLVRELLNDKNKTVLNDQDREKLAFLGSDFTQHSRYDTSPKR
jgi:hypothetical protein